MIEKEEIPTTNTLALVVMYITAVVALGMSFSFTLGIINTFFALGVLGTLVNLFLALLLVRYVVAKHFTNQDS